MGEKSSDSIYSISLISLCLCGFLVNLGWGLFLPFLPFYVLVLGGTELHYGVILAAFMFSRAFFSDRFGTLSDRLGRKFVLSVGLLSYAIVSFSFSLVDIWWQLIVTQFFLGVCAGAVWPTAEAAVIDHVDPSKRGEAMSFYLTLSNFGFLTGPVIGGGLQEYAFNTLKLSLIESFRVPFFFVSALALFGLLIVFVLVKETLKKDKTSKMTVQRTESFEEKIMKVDWRSIRVLYFTGFANGIAIGLVIPVLAYFLADVFYATPFIIGLIITVSGLIGLGINFPAGRFSDKIGRRKPLVIFGNFSSRLGTVILPFAPGIWQVGEIMVLRGLGLNVSMPAGRALQADLIPFKIRGKLFGRMQAFFNVGMTLGPIVGSFAYYMFKFSELSINLLFESFIFSGMAVPFLISAVIGFISLMCFILWVQEPRSGKII